MPSISEIKAHVLTVERFQLKIRGQSSTEINAKLNVIRMSNNSMTVRDWLLKSFPDENVRNDRNISILISGKGKTGKQKIAKSSDTLKSVRETYSPIIRDLANTAKINKAEAERVKNSSKILKAQATASANQYKKLQIENLTLQQRARKEKSDAAAAAATNALRDELNKPENRFHARVITLCQTALNQSGFDNSHYINFLLRALSRVETDKDDRDAEIEHLKKQITKLLNPE